MILIHIHQGSAASTNSAPLITPSPTSITAATASFPYAVAVTATASDAEDGDITADIQWSNTDTGGSATYSFAEAGSFTIFATVVDSGGLSATAFIPVTITTSGGGGSGNTTPIQNGGVFSGMFDVPDLPGPIDA